MKIDYDKIESLMAGSLGSLSMMYRAEVALKKHLVEFFNVELEFEYEYKDLTIIMPEELKEVHPFITSLGEYDWVFFSEHTDGKIMFLNRKATTI